VYGARVSSRARAHCARAPRAARAAHRRAPELCLVARDGPQVRVRHAVGAHEKNLRPRLEVVLRRAVDARDVELLQRHAKRAARGRDDEPHVGRRVARVGHGWQTVCAGARAAGGLRARARARA
jgi:hypothetical protein